MKKQLISSPIVSLILFALFNLFSSGRWTLAAAAWLTSVFALHFLYTHQGRRTYKLFFLVNWATVAIAWYGATPIWGMAYYVFMAFTALIGSLPYFLARWLDGHFRQDGRFPFAATFIFPLVVTAIEFLSVNNSPLGNFGAAAYSQYGIPAFMQLTAVTGMLGLTFLMAWFAAVVNWARLQGVSHRRVQAGLAACAAVLVLVAGFGFVRLQTAPASTNVDTVPVTGITLTHINMQEMNALLAADRAAYQARTQQIHADYLAATETAAAAGAKIVVWPEAAGLGLAKDVAALVSAGQVLAQRADIYLAIPTLTVYPDSDRPAENMLSIADPQGEIVLEHVKYGGNMMEGSLAGSGVLQTVETPYGTLSGIICWDTDFPGVVRQAGRQGVDIMLSPSLEWAGIDPLHGEMAAFRAVENGMTIVRQADMGWSVVVDSYGRTLASADSETTTMHVAVPTQGVDTLYARIGDALGLLSVAGVAVLGALVLIARWRERHAQSEMGARDLASFPQ